MSTSPSVIASPSSERFSTLDALRGLASLGVAWFHFTQGNPRFLHDGLLKRSGKYGWLGVEVFFVISGFIIPYALQRSKYTVTDYGTFIIKRILRLDPPYLLSIVVLLVLGYLSALAPGFRGTGFSISIPQLALHFGYANAFFGYPWLNPAFWTLAIELQYYLLIGLLFPLISCRSLSVRMCAFCGLTVVALSFPLEHFILGYLFLFMFGMAAFQFRAGLLSASQFAASIALLGLGAWQVNGPVITIAGVTTAAAIGFIELGVYRPLVFFGQISYSLYLLHVPIGGRVVNLGERFAHSTISQVAILAVALVASTAASWLLYKFVELPSQRWSSAIRYGRKRARPSGIVSIMPVSAESLS